MDEEPKTELGEFIAEEMRQYLGDKSKLVFDIFGTDYREIANHVLAKIEELSEVGEHKEIKPDTWTPDQNKLNKKEVRDAN